jgi:hypothetical protein
MARRTRRGIKYRSGFEAKVQKAVEVVGFRVKYEFITLSYKVPESWHKYTPDFLLTNGIIVEAKGIFDSDDRKKHLLVREQHPDKDIRFVFQRDQRIYKGSATRYSDWCDKHDFKYALKEIPKEWLDE